MPGLVGRRAPDVPLPSTAGEAVSLAHVPGLAVVFCYPYTGRPGTPDPEGWDNIPGAHGSTPQALSYSKLYPEFSKHQVKVFGLSFQAPDWQDECVQRLGLAVPLLSDEGRRFAAALTLPVFAAGAQTFLVRQTLLLRDGTIIGARLPVPDPAADAAETLALCGARA